MERDQHHYVSRRKTWTLIVEALALLVLLGVIAGGALTFVAP